MIRESMSLMRPEGTTATDRHGSGVLEISGLGKDFEGAVAVSSIDLTVQPGEFLTLLGPSGCGKTTLLRMIAGFETPSCGTITLGGQDLTRLPAERRPLNMVFQRYALFPHLSVAENVAYGLRNKGLKGSTLSERVTEGLRQVDLGDMGQRPVGQLSGGQAQRVALARAIVNQPDVLLLDEPLGALDMQLRKRMQVELRSLHQKLGMTFIYVTHDQEEALAMSDRIAVMREGAVEQLGTPEEIYQRPASRYVASFIGEATLLHGTVSHSDDRGCTVELSVTGPKSVLTAETSDRWRVGDQVVIAVRPENMQLTPPTEGRLTGTVVEVMYLGAYYRHWVRLSDGTLAKCDLTAPRADVADLVGLDWTSPSSLVVAL